MRAVKIAHNNSLPNPLNFVTCDDSDLKVTILLQSCQLLVNESLVGTAASPL